MDLNIFWTRFLKSASKIEGHVTQYTCYKKIGNVNFSKIEGQTDGQTKTISEVHLLMNLISVNCQNNG